MSIGALFMVLSFILFFLVGIGVRAIPMADIWAHASLVLGLLLGGYPLPWWGPRP